jgi:hypothetical protein
VAGHTLEQRKSHGVEPPKPALHWHHDWFALTNVGMLVLMIIMAGAIWALASRPSDVVLQFATSPEPLPPVDAGKAPEPSGDTDASGFERAGDDRIRPSSPLASVAASTSGRAAPPAGREPRRAPP